MEKLQATRVCSSADTPLSQSLREGCLENQGLVFLPVDERGGIEASLEAAVEVALVFKTAVEGDFENACVGGAQEPCGVVDPQVVDEFGGGIATVFPEFVGGVSRGVPGKTEQGWKAFDQMRRMVHLRAGMVQPAGRMAEWQVGKWFLKDGEDIHKGALEFKPVVYCTV